MESKQALHNDYARWLQNFRPRGSSVRDEVVHGEMHLFLNSQSGNLLDQQFVFQRFRCVKVYPCALRQRQMREVTIVAVKLDHVGLQCGRKMLRQEALPGTGRSGDTDEIGFGGHEQTSLAHRTSGPCDIIDATEERLSHEKQNCTLFPCSHTSDRVSPTRPGRQ